MKLISKVLLLFFRISIQLDLTKITIPEWVREWKWQSNPIDSKITLLLIKQYRRSFGRSMLVKFKYFNLIQHSLCRQHKLIHVISCKSSLTIHPKFFLYCRSSICMRSCWRTIYATKPQITRGDSLHGLVHTLVILFLQVSITLHFSTCTSILLVLSYSI